jgi:hypothetical protein
MSSDAGGPPAEQDVEYGAERGEHEAAEEKRKWSERDRGRRE